MWAKKRACTGRLSSGSKPWWWVYHKWLTCRSAETRLTQCSSAHHHHHHHHRLCFCLFRRYSSDAYRCCYHCYTVKSNHVARISFRHAATTTTTTATTT